MGYINGVGMLFTDTNIKQLYVTESLIHIILEHK